MIMGVSSGAYAAGLFHLMTHAFFKALLFMAAGSIIGAMARRPVARPDGRLPHARCRSPSAASSSAAWRWRACRRSPGFFSKDDILPFVGERGGWHWILYVVGYIGAFLTAIYTFRMIFRAFLRRAVPGGAGARGRATCTTPRCRRNPLTGEEEDTDVGFPGPGPPHRRARAADEDRDGRARRAARSSAACSRSRGVDRRSSTSSSSRRSPTRTARARRPTGSRASGLVIGTVLAVAGIALAYCMWVRGPGCPAGSARGSARPTSCSSTSGTSTRSTTAAIVRPCAAVGRFCRDNVRALVRRRRCWSAARPASCGAGLGRRARRPERLPALYAALLLVGVAGVALYFLIVSSVMSPLDPDLAARGRRACSAALLPRAPGAARSCSPASLVGAGAGRSSTWSTSTRGKAGLQFVTDTMWISELGIHYKLGARRAQPVPGRLTTRAVRGRAARGQPARVGAPAPLLLHVRAGRDRACSARSARRTSRCSSPSST